MPTAQYANANCTQCHDLGGQAPYHIDFNIINNSDYVHNQSNASASPRKYPLNFNASNGSALRAAEKRYAGVATVMTQTTTAKPTSQNSPQPPILQDIKSKNMRAVPPECFLSMGSPQNVAHSYNITYEIRTPNAPNCYDCHGVTVMYNTSHRGR